MDCEGLLCGIIRVLTVLLPFLKKKFVISGNALPFLVPVSILTTELERLADPVTLVSTEEVLDAIDSQVCSTKNSGSPCSRRVVNSRVAKLKEWRSIVVLENSLQVTNENFTICETIREMGEGLQVVRRLVLRSKLCIICRRAASGCVVV